MNYRNYLKASKPLCDFLLIRSLRASDQHCSQPRVYIKWNSGEAHMFLCWMKACPFQQLPLSPLFLSFSPHHPTPLTLDFYWPIATLNYHGWKEKQIRRAWNSEADSPSLTVQKENNSNEHSLHPSVEGLDREWVARGTTREHGVFWMQDSHRVSQRV